MITRISVPESAFVITKNLDTLNYETIMKAVQENKEIVISEDAPPIPKIPHLYHQVFRWIVENRDKFNMKTWRNNNGERCIGGIVLDLGGKQAEDLVNYFNKYDKGEGIAAALIYLENVGHIPDFGMGDYAALKHVISHLNPNRLFVDI